MCVGGGGIFLDQHQLETEDVPNLEWLSANYFGSYVLFIILNAPLHFEQKLNDLWKGPQIYST